MRRFIVLAAVAACVAALFVAPDAAHAAATAGPAQVWAAQEGMDLAVTWAPPNDLAGVTGYRVTTSPGSSTVDVPVGTERAVVPGTSLRTMYTVHVSSLAGAVASAPTDAPSPVAVSPPGGSLSTMAPVRLADTREGVPAAGPTNSIKLQITNTGGIPASGVGSVVLNITVNSPQGAGYVSAYPSGTTRPTVSNLNYGKGQTVAGLAVVPVGADGSITLYSSAKAQLIADASGWFSGADGADPAALFHGLSPARLMDTRTGLGGPTPPPGTTVDLTVTGIGGVPAIGVGAVVLNLTSAGSTQDGYVTAYPAGAARPVASTLNFARGQVVANRVIVQVGAGGRISLFNFGGRTPLVVDVTGWFGNGTDPAAGGAYFAGITPTRIVDTRTLTGAAQLVVLPGTSMPVAVAGSEGIPAAFEALPPTGVIASITAVDPTESGFLTAYPSNAARPTASDLNFTAHAVVANLTVGRLGPDGVMKIFNSAGYTSVVVDAFGYFVGDSSIAPGHTPEAADNGDMGATAAGPAGHLWTAATATFGGFNGRNQAAVDYWNGTAWSAAVLPEPAGARGSRADAVAVVAPDDVWVGGSYWTDPVAQSAQVLLEHWDGTAWHLAGSPSTGSGPLNGVNAIVALAGDDIWALGVKTGGTRDAGLAEHWDGLMWTVSDAPAGVARYYAAAPDHQGGVIAVGEASNGDYVATRWGGGNPVPPPPYAGGDPLWLFGLGVLSATDGWAVGDLGHTAFRWDGAAWQRVSVPTAPNADIRLHAVSGTGPNDVWSVGLTSDSSSYHGLIEHWNGSAWSIVAGIKPGDSSFFEGVAAIGANDVWVMGQSLAGSTAKPFAEHWNGTTWTSAAVPLPTRVR